MNAPGSDINWLETNQHGLSAEIDWLRTLLESSMRELDSQAIEPPSFTSLTLDFLAESFQLSYFERNIVLLCLAHELHSDIGPLCSARLGTQSASYVTFGLAFSILPDGHWTALAPDSPLRFYQLVNLPDTDHITSAPLSLDETILHFLLGGSSQDKRLTGLVQPLAGTSTLAPSQNKQVDRLIGFWQEGGQVPIVLLRGDDPVGGLAVATCSCAKLGLQPLLMQAYDIPTQTDERTMLARRLARNHLLSPIGLVVDGRDNPPPYLASFIEQLPCPVILLGDRPIRMHSCPVALEVDKPTPAEQQTLWEKNISSLDEDGRSELPVLTAQFDLGVRDIATIAASVNTEVQGGKNLGNSLWQQCRHQSRDGLDHLAQRIVSLVSWDDLVLPEGKKRILRDICHQVHHRKTVYETWGFGDKSPRGLGISALFIGESGTGKTLAAEVVATELNLDLYRIDLSSVVSKYIGETEKNLEKLFSAAESSGAILLFDEADALFGKRTEIKDSHDRYANIELSYLLQRMESYRGLSILTSNMKSALDTAFLRRIRFVLQFPFPDIEERRAIWQSILPDKLPQADIDLEQLARLNLAGGNIRNIAINGAFSAAEKKRSLTMADLAHGARMEYAKLEKPINEAELRRWT